MEPDAGVIAAIRLLDGEGGWDHDCDLISLEMYGALCRAARTTEYVERSSAYGVTCWRLTDEGIAFRRKLEDS